METEHNRETKYEGMIGSRPCDKALEHILEKLDNPHITNVVTRLLHAFSDQCRLLRDFVVEHDRAFAIDMLDLCKHKALESIKRRGEEYSHDLISHWQCCLIGRYRNTINMFRNYPNKRQVQNARVNYLYHKGSNKNPCGEIFLDGERKVDKELLGN